jgi:hypothetical protein
MRECLIDQFYDHWKGTGLVTRCPQPPYAVCTVTLGLVQLGLIQLISPAISGDKMWVLAGCACLR